MLNLWTLCAQCCQSWLVAQLSRNLIAIPKIPGSNPGVVKFLVCHPLGMPNPGERLGFNLVHKKCSPQNYKRGGGMGGSKVGWVGPKLGGWVLSKIPPPPSYKRSLRPNAFRLSKSGLWGRHNTHHLGHLTRMPPLCEAGG